MAPANSDARATWQAHIPLITVGLLFFVALAALAVRPPAPITLCKPASTTQRDPPLLLPPDLHSPVALWGSLPKAGPSAMVVRLAAGELLPRLTYSADWSLARLEAAVRGQPRIPPPAPFCGIMVNHMYRLVYLKPTKVAGTTTMGYFGECGIGTPSWPMGPTHDYCLSGLNASDPADVAHLAASWPDYFVFGFARNVLARAVSSYVYLASNPQCPSASWDAFCRDPYVMGDVCFDAAAASAFRDCCTAPWQHQYSHVAPQAHCFATPDGRTAVDWLGRVEHWDEDFNTLIDLLNERTGVPRLPRPLGRVKRLNYANDSCQGAPGAPAPAPVQLSNEEWEGNKARPGTYIPCNQSDYFLHPEHAHCIGDLLDFFAEDFAFFQQR